jgi:hypothetical protein
VTRNLFGDEEDGPASPTKAARVPVRFEIPPSTLAVVCSGPRCKDRVYWVTTKTGKHMPVSEDGSPHWATCVDAPSFRRKAAKEAK